jgi:phospholipid-binding lipoprotein MlaA
MRISRYLMMTILAATCLLGGCATIPSGKADPRDRFERLNRSVYRFNSTLDHAVLRPVARGYVNVTPVGARRCVSNFFSNLGYPVTVINDMLQGKVRDGVSDSARFGINTVVGVGGLFDPATRWNLGKHNEDFGQTLGKWGVPSGPYLMLPLLGPSTVRDAPARLVDSFASPQNYITDTNAVVALYLSGAVNARANLLSQDHLIDDAYDPYAFVRNVWLQRREYEVRDGDIPLEVLPEDGIEAPQMQKPE